MHSVKVTYPDGSYIFRTLIGTPENIISLYSGERFTPEGKKIKAAKVEFLFEPVELSFSIEDEKMIDRAGGRNHLR